MTVKIKFLWNVLVIFSIAFGAYCGYRLYQMNETKSKLFDNYNSETVGTDLRLKEKLSTLEKNLLDREKFKFNITQNPTDLSSVVPILGDGDFRRYSSMAVTGIISGKRPSAIISYKDKNFHVFPGDSVAGGRITSISPIEVVYTKNDEIRKYSLKPNTQPDNKN